MRWRVRMRAAPHSALSRPRPAGASGPRAVRAGSPRVWRRSRTQSGSSCRPGRSALRRRCTGRGCCATFRRGRSSRCRSRISTARSAGSPPIRHCATPFERSSATSACRSRGWRPHSVEKAPSTCFPVTWSRSRSSRWRSRVRIRRPRSAHYAFSPRSCERRPGMCSRYGLPGMAPASCSRTRRPPWERAAARADPPDRETAALPWNREPGRNAGSRPLRRARRLRRPIRLDQPVRGAAQLPLAVTYPGRREGYGPMRWLSGVFAALALLAAGCGGTTAAGTGGADIVPASAPAFIAVNMDVDSSQWQTVDQLASRFPDKEKALKIFREGLRNEGLSWDRDVKPALGPELDMVWLDFDNDGEDFVALMQPSDESKFDKLIAKEQGTSSDLFRAKVGGWQVLAPSQELIDRFKRESGSGDSLADRDAFQEAMHSYPDDWLFRGYVDGATLMALARREQDPDFRKIFPKLGRLASFATHLRATSDGIRWDANVHGTPGPAFKGLSPTKPFGPALPHEVPKDALAYATFHGAKGAFDKLENNPMFTDVPEFHRYSALLRRIGLLLEGENAVYVRPAPSGKIPEITFIAEPAAGTNGMATLDRILSRYRAQLELPSRPKATRVAGIPARVFFADPFKVYYANVGKRLVITDFPAGIKALRGNPPSLAQSKEYQGALDSSGMPSKTQGFLYVNVHGGISYAERLMNAPVPREVGRNLRPLRSAVEYAATRPSEIQVTFFLRIK